MADQTEMQTSLAVAAASKARENFDPAQAGNFALVPEGYCIENLEVFQVAPNRVIANNTFVSAASFSAYLSRHYEDRMFLTASADRAELVAIIDYHQPRFSDPYAKAGFCDHKAKFKARRSDKLKAWLAMTGKPLTQIEFGLFLEERAVDVIKPDAASVMEMVMKFEATKKVDFKSSQRLSDGSRQFTYVEDNQARGGITLPDRLTIFVPVYQGMEPQPIEFLLRYRIQDAALRFVIEMHDKQEVLDEAFNRCVDAVLHGLTFEPPTVHWIE